MSHVGQRFCWPVPGLVNSPQPHGTPGTTTSLGGGGGSGVSRGPGATISGAVAVRLVGVHRHSDSASLSGIHELNIARLDLLCRDSRMR